MGFIFFVIVISFVGFYKGWWVLYSSGRTVRFSKLDCELDMLIKERVDFTVVCMSEANFSKAVRLLEKRIESKGLKCRVYTHGRGDALLDAGEFVPHVSAIGLALVAAHRLVTKNPHYEIAKKNGFLGRKIFVKSVG